MNLPAQMLRHLAIGRARFAVNQMRISSHKSNNLSPSQSLEMISATTFSSRNGSHELAVVFGGAAGGAGQNPQTARSPAAGCARGFKRNILGHAHRCAMGRSPRSVSAPSDLPPPLSGVAQDGSVGRMPEAPRRGHGTKARLPRRCRGARPVLRRRRRQAPVSGRRRFSIVEVAHRLVAPVTAGARDAAGGSGPKRN
jgi:hypothetical protein